jgi:4'-phosphopantetheinyl transferase
MSSGPSHLPLGRVEVWWARLDSPNARESDHPDDLNEARQIPGVNRRHALLVRRTILRELVGGYIACAPEAVALRRDSRATRPYVARCPDLCFSAACRGSTAVFAFARGRAVGIDLEQADDANRRGALPGSFLSREERWTIGNLPEPKRRLELLRWWTLKEAIAKGTGLGARLAFDEIDLRLCASRITAGLPGALGVESWRAAILPTSPELVGAVALEGGWDELTQLRVPSGAG